MATKTHSTTAIAILALFAGLMPCLETIKGADQPEEKIIQERLNSMSRLKQMGTALMLYSGDNNETYPANIDQLRPYLDSNMAWIFSNVSYRKIAVASRPDTPMAFDRTMFSKGNGTSVLYNDGHVEFVPPDKLAQLGIPQIFFLGTSPDIGVLCGHITDAKTGQPVTDATVTVQNILRVQTDLNGFYLIENLPAGPNFSISIDSNEYVGITDYRSMPLVYIQKDKQTTRDFKLDKACMVEVRVADEANQPVEGAEFSITPFDNELRRKFMTGPKRYAQTNKDGIALLGGLPPSKMGYIIIANHYTYTESLREDGTKISTRQPDYAPGKLIVILNSTEYLESGRIVLQKGADVAGYAMYEDGLPASDLTISASYSYVYGNLGRTYFHDNSPVDANGNFTLRHIVPGDYEINAYIHVDKGNSKSIAEVYTALPLPDNAPLAINIPKKSAQPLASIRGNMIFTGNSIPDNINISVSSMGGKYNTSIQWEKPGKDACDTNFAIDQLMPGKYKLTFLSSYINEKTVENVDAPGEGLEVELISFDKFILRGSVVNSRTGRPVQSFKTRISQLQPLPGPQNYQPAGQWQDINNTEGKFNIDAFGPGIYQVQIAADGFAWVCSENINTDRNVPVVVKLVTGGSIKGSVVDENGKPVNGAKVMPLSKANVSMNFAKDDYISESIAVETVNGSFVLNNLTAGEESIKIVHPDYTFSIVGNIVVKEGRTTEGVKVVLHKGGTVEGYVYDSAGQPQSGITLIFQNTIGFNPNPLGEKAGQLATVTTDADGYYRVEGLPEQICYVQRHKERNTTGVVCRAFVPAGGKVTRYDFGGSPVVKGRVVFDGKPLANYKLDLTTTERPHSSVFQCSATTGPDGEFTFGGVPKGTWSIYCVDPENRANMMKISTIDTAGRDLDIGVIPAVLSTVTVSMEYEQGASKWDNAEAYLQYKNIAGSQPIAKFKPDGENSVFTAENILPGEYRLVLSQDNVTLQRIIEISGSNTDITVRIPKCTAGIQGRLVSKYNDYQALWRDGRDIVGYIKPDANGNYELNNLPAGHYHLSANMLTNSETLLELDLAEGEQKVLDIDAATPRKNQRGVLQVSLLDEYGVPVTEADVRLQDNIGTIEPIISSKPVFYFEAAPGTYTLTAKIAGYKEIKQSVEIKIWDFQKTKRPPDPVLLWLAR